MGSVTHVVDADGIVLNRYEYDAWGNTNLCEEKVPNRFKFTGQQLDPVTQQYYLRARFYNPVIARFTQEDTYRGDGLNLYAYCTNNPILYADLTGHEKDLLSRHSNDSTFEERFNQNLQEELVFNKQRGLQTYLKYSKEYNFNISTPDTPTGSHRVFINLDSKPGKTNRNSQFPHYKGNSNG